MAKKWEVSAPNNQYIEVEYNGSILTLRHGQTIENAELAARYSQYLFEVESAERVQKLVEPAPKKTVNPEVKESLTTKEETLLTEVPVVENTDTLVEEKKKKTKNK